MFVTIINDCSDGNARGRQSTRVSELFGVTPTFVPVGSTLDAYAELEAAGNLVDMLDAGEGKEGIILVNVAPRSGHGKKWPNGTPFGYFRYKDTLVLSSIAGETLSIAKKLGILNDFQVFDIPTVLDAMLTQGKITEAERKLITNTQFRSFEFLPRAAYWLHTGLVLPATSLSPDDVPDVGSKVWEIDNFGNLKTTILSSEVSVGDVITVKGAFKHYERLKDVPEGETAAVTGSSGLPNAKFIEIVTQGKNTAKLFGLSQGDLL